MKNPQDLYYSQNHEWVAIEDDTATIGITDYAQAALGDIVFVELPEEGSELEAGDVLGVVESVKSASDIYAPVAGTVTKVNQGLEDEPEKINEQAFQTFIAVLKLSDTPDLDTLMDAGQYKKFCEEES